MRRRARSWSGRRYRDRRLRRVQHRRQRQEGGPRDSQSRCRFCWPDRCPVQSISARARPGASVPRRRPAGGDRRVSHIRLHLDAARTAGRSAGRARSRRHAVRRRRRRPHGRSRARHRGGNAEAALQFPLRSARPRSGDHPVPAEPHDQAYRRSLHQLRCRPRLPVSMLVLHHHQRAGPQVALPLGRRHRADRALERRARHHALLRHRRQFRTQPQLGTDLRPADRAARGREVADQAVPAGRHALPPHSRLHREGGARRLHLGVHRAREHQPQITDGGEEAAEQDLGIPRDAPAVAQAKGNHLRGLHPRLPDRYARRRSRAISRSSKRNSRSTSWSSPASPPSPARKITRSCI